MDGIPMLRNLRFLERTSLPISFDEEWTIPIARSDDVLWSIVLSYLNSFSESNKADVSLHGKHLLGTKVGKNFAKYVEKCNPFLYRNACFSNEIESKLVESFRRRIRAYYQINKGLFLFDNYSYICLQASSFLLSCNIFLCEDSTNGPDKLFPDVLPFAILPKKLVIFVTFEKSLANNSVCMKYLSFCIPKELGFEKQKQALQEILLKTKFLESGPSVKNVAKSICTLPNIRENFLDSLLSSNFAECIPFIYKSPYVLSKLRDAAIEIDPTIENRDNNKSALFLALTRSSPNLLYFLYDHAANACLLTQGSIRSPDPIIISNLVVIKDLLNGFKEKMQSSDLDNTTKCNSLKNLNELCRFNNFQIDVCTKINNIRQRINYYVDSSGMNEAEQRKDVILHILQSYETYFDWEDCFMYSEDEISIFKKFYEHGDYFKNLDFCSAIMFFDNLFLLKERLLLSDKSYLNIESQFFFFIYSRKYFETIVDEVPNFLLASRLIIFNERLSLKKRLSSFKETLENEDICYQNVVHQLPESVVRTLVNIPQIYDEFLVLKLNHYLNAVTKINEINMKAILILQRTLQVIGECVKETNFKSVENILSLIFPAELVTNFKKIRNKLSHPNEYELSYRKYAEENSKLFRNIKSEIMQIKGILSPIFSAQKYAMDQYVVLLTRRGVNEVEEKEIPEMHQPYFMNILSSTEIENQNSGNNDFQDTWGKYIHEMKHWIESKATLNDQDKELITNNTVKQYSYIIKNIFSSVKKKIKCMNNKLSSIQEAKMIDRLFYSIEYFLSHIMNDNNISVNNSRKLLERIVDRETLFRISFDGFKTKQHDENKNITPAIGAKEIKRIKHQNNIASKDSNFDHLHNIKESNENVNTEDILSDCDFAMFNNSEPEHIANLFATNSDNCKKNIESSGMAPPIPEELSISEENRSSNNEHLNETDTFYEAVETILSDYEGILEEMLTESNCEDSRNDNFKFDNIDIFRKTLNGCYYLNGNEKDLLLKSIPENIQSILKTQNKVKNYLEKTYFRTLNKEEFDKLISELPLKVKEKKELLDDFFLEDKSNSLSIINSIHDLKDVQDLKAAIANNELGKKSYDTLCENLNLKDDSKEILGKIVQGQKLKVRENQLEFLRNRIRKLKIILIDENKDIKQLWESATSPRKKSYVHEIIVHLYLNDTGIQASVEMLLFDCMNILKTEDLQTLCRKTTNLFNGINLRNVLAHGNPLLEYLGRLLDPTDLPSELVRKMLSLVSDLQIIDYMLEVINKSGYRFSSFVQFMMENQDGELKDLQEKLDVCDKWKQYAFLIPQNECDDEN